MTSVPPFARTTASDLPMVAGELARRVVDDAVRRYFRQRRAMIPDFVARNYSLAGALDTHRKAFGHDLWRAPLNAALVGPAVAMRGIAWGLDKAGRPKEGAWLRSREIFMQTDVARELEWRLQTEFFELPYADGARVSRKDALAAEILKDKRLASVLETLNGPWGEEERRRLNTHLSQSLAIYTNGRFAAGEIANLMLTAGLGGAIVHQVTPGVWSLGPALAAWLADKIAISSFPLGPALGAVLTGVAPASPGLALTVGATGAVIAATAVFSAVSGVVTDPLQAALGLHQKRLLALSDALEAGFLDRPDARFVTREEYVVRVAEIIDVALAAWRFARH